MTLTVNLRKMLHRKSTEYCTSGQFNAVAGAFVVSDKSDAIPLHDAVYGVFGVSAITAYVPDQDAWISLPNSGIAGTFAAGSCGEFRNLSAPGGAITNTATAGTVSTMTTALTLTRNLLDHEIRVVAGTGAGYSGKISSNTMGANAVITVTPASSVAFDNTTQFQIFGGSLWFFNAGTTAVGFAVYDRITNAWTQRSVTGLPTAWGTDGQLVSTPGRTSNKGNGFVNGTATAGASTTLTTTKTAVVNQWANYQVRIISGTGAGQIRSIASNTAGANTVLTVSSAWTVTPDATSVYRIEGNDDYFYLLGNNAVTLYRYSISGNTWTTLSPSAARASAPGAGLTADWIDGVQEADWQDENSAAPHYTSILVRQNGRYIYSWRGGAGSTLDVYDIALNTWRNGIVYGNQQETFTTGSCSVDLDGHIYIQKDATGRIYKFDVHRHVLEPFTFNPVPQGASAVGDKMFITTFREGATEVNYLYSMCNTRTELTRWLVI